MSADASLIDAKALRRSLEGILMDVVFLARIQFAANITFHILFPAISIALGWVLLFFRLKHLRATDPQQKLDWLRAYRLWTKIFALTFALGVVSGVTMSFQFGTNWPGYMERVGNIAGPLLGYEVLTAFFLEAGFLGVMLFGHRRVGEMVHLGSTFLVALGTLMSAFWILALNSWMQTPAGYEIIDGQFHAKNWLEIIFNPSFPYRLVHMVLASALTCAFLLIGISAWQILKGVATASCVTRAADRARFRFAGRAGADGGGRSSRAQHAEASAAEGRGDGRYLGNNARRAASSVRDPG